MRIQDEHVFPLSYQQEHLLYLSLLKPDSSVWNLMSCKRVRGKLNLECLRQAIKNLVNRQKALSIRIQFMDDEPMQYISDFQQQTEVIDYSYLDVDAAVEEAVQYINQENLKSFHIINSPLFDSKIIKLSPNDHMIMFKIHHIISDASSFDILWHELADMYNHNLNHEEYVMEELSYTYRDYCIWQKDVVINDKLLEQANYWMQEYNGQIRTLNLPADKIMHDANAFHGALLKKSIPHHIIDKLRMLCFDYRVMLFSMLLSGFYLLLNQYSRDDEIVVGTVFSGRHHHKDIRKLIGFFVNTVAIKVPIDEEQTIHQFVKLVHKKVDEAYSMQDYPFSKVIEDINPDRNSKNIKNPLTRVMFNMVGESNSMKAFQGIYHEQSYEPVIDATQTDLLFDLHETNKGVDVVVEYNTDIFYEETVLHMMDYYIQVLQTIAEQQVVRIKDISLLDEKMEDVILNKWNSTYRPYENNCSIIEVFEQEVSQHPNKTAVVCDHEHITYKELNKRANKMGNMLREKGIDKDVVAILAKRSLKMVISILGILKCGGTYMPMDTSYPKNRMLYMLRDSNAKILLVEDKDDAIEFGGVCLMIGDETSYRDTRVPVACNPDDLAYIMYTSGSTGQPKGVMVKHKNVLRLVRNTNYISWNTEDKILQTGSPAFDATTFEIWGALLNGVELHVVDNDVLLNAVQLEHYVNHNGITTMWLTSALFNQVLDERPQVFSHLKHLLVGGDVLSPKHINKVRELYDNLTVLNGYGPTENTTFSTIYSIDDEHSFNIPIGKPIANSTAYIMNTHMKLLPAGIPGELYVGGDGVARGYLNKSELTKTKFLGNPYKQDDVLYKTGDLARWRFDGNIEFLGRIDNQIKLRGYRIELEEIQVKLNQHTDIKESVVVVNQDKQGDKYLCGYVVAHKAISQKDINEYLKQQLPDYMVPTYYVFMNSLPLNHNGKLNKKALPEPQYDHDYHDTAIPDRLEEIHLIKIWQEVLSRQDVSVEDNFFALGGHSLKATSMMSRINKTFQIDLPLREIFKHPTVRGLAQCIQSKQHEAHTPIVPYRGKGPYPLSSSQKRIYLIDQASEKGIQYNVPTVLKFKGSLDKVRLEETLKQIIHRHESLRTSFSMCDGEPVQVIHHPFDFHMDDLTHKKENIQDTIQSYVRPFDLSKGPLIRAGIMDIADEEYLLIMDMHHIVIDGVSIGVLLSDMSAMYQGLPLNEPIQYKDYCQWEKEYQLTDHYHQQKEYWHKTLGQEPQTLQLPMDYKRPGIQDYQGSVVKAKINTTIVQGLHQVCRQHNATMYMVLLSAFNILLSRYCRQNDVLIGCPVSGRNHVDTEHIVGMFVNTIVMKNQVNEDQTFASFLSNVVNNTIKAYDNQDYPFDCLVNDYDHVREQGKNPLVNVMLSLPNMDVSYEIMEGIHVEEMNWDYNIAKFDLTLTALEREHEMELELEYATSLFKPSTMERMMTHYMNILEQIIHEQDLKIQEITLLDDDEKEKLLGWKGITRHYESHQTLIEMFQQQVANYPERLAVKDKHQQLTYHELDQQSNQMARLLQAHGLSYKEPVGILARRSIETIVSILGILKCGGVYMPIDVSYPPSRIDHMLKESGANILIKDKDIHCSLNSTCTCIPMDAAVEAYDQATLPSVGTSANLAYIMYTSGSTGTPKGVMVTQKNILRLVRHTDYIQFTEGQRILQTGSPAFDATTFEIWGALLNGLTLHIVNEDIILSAKKLETYVHEHGIDILWLTSALFNQLADESVDIFKPLQYLLVGGDVLSPKHINKVRKAHKKLKILNGYGPTENTTFSTIHSITKTYESNIPIGRPITNSTAYILDEHLQLVPIGVPGELCVGGDGLALGYLNNASLTQEKFIRNPYKPDETIYRTGDLARWLEDGTIEFLGRIDNQVKIRGYRIELGEIETQMNAHEAVKEAVVLVKEDHNHDKYICAYLVMHKGLTWHPLQHFLQKQLPDYMIPQYFIEIERLPLNANGKLDKKALTAPDLSKQPVTAHKAPSEVIEIQLATLWQDVLRYESVSIEDDFFHMGGHSLKAAWLVSKLHKRFGIEMTIRDVFRYSTINKMAEHIKTLENIPFTSIQHAPEADHYPLSPSQKRMYVLHKIDGQGIAYNVPTVLEIEGQLDLSSMEQALQKLVSRHEALRTSFEVIEGETVQIVNDVILDIERQVADVQDIDSMVNNFIRPFELSQAPLVRASLVSLSNTKTILMLDMHHIVSDGVSLGILFKDLGAFYNNMEKESQSIQYKDYAYWMNQERPRHKELEHYWLDTFREGVPILNLMTDYKRPDIQTYQGNRIGSKLDKHIADGIKRLCQHYHATPYMILLSAYTILLAKYSSQEEIIVGSPLAGRHHMDIEQTVGMFVNTLPIKNKVVGQMDYGTYLKQVKANVLGTFDHQDYQLDELVDLLEIDRNPNRNPMFDVVFSMPNVGELTLDIQGVHVKELGFQYDIAKFDLTLTALEREDVIELELEYATSLFKPSTMERMMAHYMNILEQIIHEQDLKIQEITLLDDEEKEKLLGWKGITRHYESHQTLIEMFQQQVAKYPERLAVKDKHQQLTYHQLDQQSNQMARLLQAHGLAYKEPVGILARRSIETIVSILGILKCGGVYMPIDVSYPPSRIDHMLKESGANILIKDKDIHCSLNSPCTCIQMDVAVEAYDQARLPSVGTSSSLAYIMYTSGSTGTPKGVMVTQKNILRLVRHTDYIQFTEGQRILQTGSPAFDATTFEIWGALLNGLTLHIVNEDIILSAKKLETYVHEHGIDILWLTSALFNQLADESVDIFKPLQYLLVGGDVLSPKHINKVRKAHKKLKILNGYGPTENTTFSTIHSITKTYESNIPIGRPITNSTAYILDEHLQLVPIGVPGELCVGGDGLALGYLNNASLTQEKFIRNPYKPYETIYRTGDLARWLEDGTIEFLGRIDNQVKIRGYRIELGEIETILNSYAGIEEAAVLVKEDHKHHKYISAFIVTTHDVSLEALNKYLYKQLPEYMMPQCFTVLDSLPLNANGKLDKKALKEINQEAITKEITTDHMTSNEQLLTNIIRELMTLEKVSLNDNFFQIGGNSLMLMHLVSEIDAVFGVAPPVVSLMRAKTLSDICDLIEESEGVGA